MTAGRLQQTYFASAIEPAGSHDRRERSARAVGQPGSSDDLAIGRFEHDGDVLSFGKSFFDLERRSRPLADRSERSDDVRFLQRSAAVFSAADRCRMVVIEADQKDLAGARAGADLD